MLLAVWAAALLACGDGGVRGPHAVAPAAEGTEVAAAPEAERATATARVGSPATVEAPSPAVTPTKAAVGSRSQPETTTTPATATTPSPATATTPTPATATTPTPATATTPTPVTATTTAPATATDTAPAPEADASRTPVGNAQPERPAPSGARAPSGGARRAPADPAGTATPVSKPAPTGADAGVPYTWRDGDRTRSARLQLHLVLQRSSDNAADDVVLRNDGVESIVERQARHGERGGLPVFRSEGGALMTLPGGVLLVLDPDWDETRINRFFSANAIKPGRVTAQAFADNAFLVETDPGFPSLELANALAGQDGVLIASPNWRSEVMPR